MTLTEKLPSVQHTYKRDGVVLLKNILSADWLQKLRDAVDTEVLKGDRYFVRVQVDGAESPVNFDDSSPQVVVYVIRDNLQPPKYNSSDKTLTLTVDPAVQEGQTVVLTIEKTTESRSYSFNSEAVENGGNKVIFELTEVETGLYRIGLKIEGAQAINQPEIAIS